MLILTCTSDELFDVVEWIIVNQPSQTELPETLFRQNGLAERSFKNISNVSSTMIITNPSDDFISYMRCISNNGIVYKDVLIIKGKQYL